MQITNNQWVILEILRCAEMFGHGLKAQQIADTINMRTEPWWKLSKQAVATNLGILRIPMFVESHKIYDKDRKPFRMYNKYGRLIDIYPHHTVWTITEVGGMCLKERIHDVARKAA